MMAVIYEERNIIKNLMRYFKKKKIIYINIKVGS